LAVTLDGVLLSGTPVMNHPLVLPMAAHAAMTAFLYVLLTLARAPKVWGAKFGADVEDLLTVLEPRLSANLSNQFEWPVLFYVACLLLVQTGGESLLACLLAWGFVLGRVVHSFVQITTSNVRWRGIVFSINFLAVLGLWVLLAA